MEHWRLRAVAAAMILGLGLNYLGIRKEARHNVEEVGPLSDQQTRTSFFYSIHNVSGHALNWRASRLNEFFLKMLLTNGPGR